MNLEYIYFNNYNIKYAVKRFLLFGLAMIIVALLVIEWFRFKTDMNFYLLITALAIVLPIIFCCLLMYVFISLGNYYKRKEFIKIKENGKHYKGTILMANAQPEPWGKGSYLIKPVGEISVIVNNKTYEIKDIDYNNEFKNLEKSLDELEKNLSSKVLNFNDASQKAKNTQMEIDVYILNDKAIGDLESIKIR